MDPTGGATLDLFREHGAYTEFLWRSLTGLSPRPCSGRVLEVGCGIGNLTRVILRSQGVRYLHALDVDPAYVEKVRAELLDPRLALSVARAEDFCPDEFSGAERGFDCIVASNVLEHIEDDARALENSRRMLRKGGVVLLLVPAHPALYSTLDRSLFHYRRYRREDMETLATRASLRVIRMRHFNPLGALGWWLNGKILRRRMLPAKQISLYSRFALPVSAWLDRWNPLPLGVSLLAVLERMEPTSQT